MTEWWARAPEILAVVLTAMSLLAAVSAKFTDLFREFRGLNLLSAFRRSDEVAYVRWPDSESQKTPAKYRMARQRVNGTLDELEDVRDKQRTRARVSAFASNLLSIAQYVLGGVLASSFIQEALSPKWVGALGVLVLLASLIRQQFHPELDAERARKKVRALTSLIRTTRDRVAILQAGAAAGEDRSDAMINLMTQITASFNAIENDDGKAPLTVPQTT